MENQKLISLHGGHSGQFCCHAKDTLEDIILAYIEKGFTVAGITEHMPAPTDDLRYPDEIQLGLSALDLLDRMALYFEELNRLKNKYRGQMTIYRGFETETVTGGLDHARLLIKKFDPDYIVGSVHHVKDRCFDYSPQHYQAIARDCGSLEAMYLQYFDEQFEMIETLKPFVVGHFDIIRIYDDDYPRRLAHPDIFKKIKRNLELVKRLGLVLDYNLRPLARGEKHPYLDRTILELARQMEIPVVPGDDAHSKAQAGAHVAHAVQTLTDMGFSTRWPTPRLMGNRAKKD